MTERREVLCSGEEGDALVGGEDGVGGGPAVEDAHDLRSCSAHDTGGGVPQLPAQRLGLGGGEPAGQAQQLEPAHEVGRVTHQRQPGPVGVEVAEGEAPARRP